MKRIMGLVLVVGLAAVAGCGSGGVAVDGKVVDGTKPYALPEGDSITINLTSEDGKTSCAANVEKDGTFAVKTTAGQPVPPGKYKVSVIHYHQPPATPSGKNQPSPQSPAPVETGEVWDVSSSNKSFTLDISKAKEAAKKAGTPSSSPSSKK